MPPTMREYEKQRKRRKRKRIDRYDDDQEPPAAPDDDDGGGRHSDDPTGNNNAATATAVTTSVASGSTAAVAVLDDITNTDDDSEEEEEDDKDEDYDDEDDNGDDDNEDDDSEDDNEDDNNEDCSPRFATPMSSQKMKRSCASRRVTTRSTARRTTTRRAAANQYYDDGDDDDEVLGSFLATPHPISAINSSSRNNGGDPPGTKLPILLSPPSSSSNKNRDRRPRTTNDGRGTTASVPTSYTASSCSVGRRKKMKKSGADDDDDDDDDNRLATTTPTALPLSLVSTNNNENINNNNNHDNNDDGGDDESTVVFSGSLVHLPSSCAAGGGATAAALLPPIAAAAMGFATAPVDEIPKPIMPMTNIAAAAITGGVEQQPVLPAHHEQSSELASSSSSSPLLLLLRELEEEEKKKMMMMKTTTNIDQCCNNSRRNSNVSREGSAARRNNAEISISASLSSRRRDNDAPAAAAISTVTTTTAPPPTTTTTTTATFQKKTVPKDKQPPRTTTTTLVGHSSANKPNLYDEKQKSIVRSSIHDLTHRDNVDDGQLQQQQQLKQQHQRGNNNNSSSSMFHIEEVATIAPDNANDVGRPLTLSPLLPPPPMFDIAWLHDTNNNHRNSNNDAHWTYDPVNRVIRADFTNSTAATATTKSSRCAKNAQLPPNPTDLAKLAYLMQRDDLTVISKGLTMNLSSSISDEADSHKSQDNDGTDNVRLHNFLSYLESDDRKYYKFRRYNRNHQKSVVVTGNNTEVIVTEESVESDRSSSSARNNGTVTEIDGHVEMTPREYVTYLRKRLRSSDDRNSNHDDNDDAATVEFRVDGVPTIANVDDILLYLVDADIPQLYPQLDKEYVDQCQWPDILPGGALCMMGQLPKQMQPFMGPNLYVTPPGTFTNFHQDGFGSVDSGHSCLYGTNEVVMLRRLTEPHKRHASSMVIQQPIHHHEKTESDPLMLPATTAVADAAAENILYRMPHDDDRLEKQKWPTCATIEEWRRLNYCPSVFLLTAGEHLHINKGRLHAFRKMSCDPLPEHDCHYHLRNNLLQQYPSKSDLCVSIAFDWMYLGYESEAINREVATVLEASYRIRTRPTAKALAVGETTVFALAEAITRYRSSISSRSLKNKVEPSSKAIARGILPALTFLVDRDTTQYCNLSHDENDDNHKNSCSLVDADQDPESSPVDPYGNDYFCKLCDHELANTYYHCQGCEDLLQVDFNICHYCYRDNQYCCDVNMKPYVTDPTGCHDHHNGSSCLVRCTSVSKTKMDCPMCRDVCDSCICSCHRTFAKRQRFRTDDQARRLLQQCRILAGGGDNDEEEPMMIPYFCETLQRLQMAAAATNNISNADKSNHDDNNNHPPGAPVNVVAVAPRCHGKRVVDLQIRYGNDDDSPSNSSKSYSWEEVPV